MQILERTFSNEALCIRCSGVFGIGSHGIPSGKLLQQALEAELRVSGRTTRRVVVDFRQVEYEWGDGPAWAVLPALRRGASVIFLVDSENREPLAGLFRSAWGEAVAVQVGSGP